MVTKDSKELNNDLDIIEDTIGAIGRWQILMVFLISLIRVHISWHQLGIVFLAPEPSFQCSDKNISDKCSSDCPSHEFDRSVFTETIITEWDLVCDRAFYLNNVLQPMVMAGILIGSVAFGYISDRFGRKYPMLIAALLEVITGVGAAFVPWIEAFLVLKLLTSVCIGAMLVISFILAMELIGKSYRTIVGVLIHTPYYLGYAGLGLLGYLIRDWRYFQMTISVTNIIFISYVWLIPESPRWLLSVGRTEEAIELLQRAASFNKLTTFNIKDKVLLYVQQSSGNNTKAGNFIDLIRTTEMRTRTICISIATFSIFMVFFGVSQYMGQLGDSMFMNITISGFLQLPGSLSNILIMGKIGRRNGYIMSSILSGLCCLLIMAVPSDIDWGVAVLGAFGIMFSGMAVDVSYIYTGELYPTIIRSVGMGTAAMFGKLGSTIVPFFLDLKQEQPWVPPTIFGVFTVLGALFCARLPETLHHKLPETIDEAEDNSRKKENITEPVIDK